MPEAKFRREVERYAARFPQLVLLGKKTLLEDQQTEAAIALLATLATPEAYAVLREFGLGQAGDDETRIQALFALVEADQIQTNEPVRLWQDGEWRDVRQFRRGNALENWEIGSRLGQSTPCSILERTPPCMHCWCSQMARSWWAAALPILEERRTTTWPG